MLLEEHDMSAAERARDGARRARRIMQLLYALSAACLTVAASAVGLQNALLLYAFAAHTLSFFLLCALYGLRIVAAAPYGIVAAEYARAAPFVGAMAAWILWVGACEAMLRGGPGTRELPLGPSANAFLGALLLAGAHGVAARRLPADAVTIGAVFVLMFPTRAACTTHAHMAGVLARFCAAFGTALVLMSRHESRGVPSMVSRSLASQPAASAAPSFARPGADTAHHVLMATHMASRIFAQTAWVYAGTLYMLPGVFTLVLLEEYVARSSHPRFAAAARPGVPRYGARETSPPPPPPPPQSSRAGGGGGVDLSSLAAETAAAAEEAEVHAARPLPRTPSESDEDFAARSHAALSALQRAASGAAASSALSRAARQHIAAWPAQRAHSGAPP
jgi:hypothetical protein